MIKGGQLTSHGSLPGSQIQSAQNKPRGPFFGAARTRYLTLSVFRRLTQLHLRFAGYLIRWTPLTLSQCISTLQSQPSWPSLPLPPLLWKSYRKIPFRRTATADPKLVTLYQCIIAAPWQAMGASSIQATTVGSHWILRLGRGWLSRGELSFLGSCWMGKGGNFVSGLSLLMISGSGSQELGQGGGLAKTRAGKRCKLRG